MEQTLISIIVPVRNGEQTLAGCLAGLLAQTLPRDRYEIIVVNDGSTDHTQTVAGQAGVVCISISPSGPAAARNRGALAARGEWLFFTDADCAPAPDWAERLLAAFADPNVVGAKGAYRTREQGRVPRFVQLEYLSKYERMARLPSIDFIDTYSAAYRRDTFLANGGFDTSFPTASVEDQEFSFRLARKGYKLVFAPDAIVYHRHDLNLADYVRRKFWIGYWKSFLLRRHPEKMLKDSHTPVSQRLQIALLGAAGIALGLSWLSPAVGMVCLGLSLLFALTTIPFLVFVHKNDSPILLAAPILLVARALALGAGLLVGGVGLRRRKLARKPALSGWQRVAKRALDVVGATIGLLLFGPFILACALAVKFDSPGSAFFGQERIGENGRRFKIHKLRSMRAGAELEFAAVAAVLNRLPGPVVKVPADPRVTRIGGWMRRWSIDELPQLWNVLRGEMSLVGPRPEQVSVVEQYSDWHRQRLSVKPGLTGPMQISGRGLLPLDERVQLEIDYITHYSLWRDMGILIKTLPVVISGRGAF